MMAWLAQRFELSRGESGHNLRPMEGLRGFAVFLVFLVHYATLVQPWVAEGGAMGTLIHSIHAIGNTGVDLFFVLSGYLIYGSLIARPRHFGRFMSRRVERIYPAFLAVFAIYVVLSFLVPDQSKLPADGAHAILYLGANLLLLPGLFPIEPLITVAWSLSYEMFYYVTIPLVITMLGLRSRSRAWRMGFFGAATLLIVAYCAAFGGHVRLIMFIAGILLHEVMGSDTSGTPRAAFALLALVAGLATMLLPWHGSAAFAAKVSILCVAFFVLCLACFRDPFSRVARGFSWTPLRWLGNMSYSYYLLHGLSLKVAFVGLAVILQSGSHGSWLFWTLLPIMFGVTLVPTTILFLVVERPYSLKPRLDHRLSQ
jgi:exopolysaccharide production protein ExoZ